MKFLTSRAFLWVAGGTMQLVWILLFVHFINTKVSNAYLISACLGIVVVLFIVNRNSNPMFKLAWSVLILAVPILGVTLYILFGLPSLTRKEKAVFKVCHERAINVLKNDEKIEEEIGRRSRGAYKQIEYISRWSDYPVYDHTLTEYFPLGDVMVPAMMEDIRKAKKYVFLEFFIIGEGQLLNSMLDLLEEKVREGVEVRFMYDDLGSILNVPKNFDRQIRSRGIKCVKFNPIKPLLSVIYNNRDHRKILVVDGKVGYTGGINLSDEYINIGSRYGHWKDTGIRVEGLAVKNFVSMFCEMWDGASKQKTNAMDYIYAFKEEELPKCNGYALPYADSPLDNEKVGENVYLNIINRAKDYIYIFTPYLIIDNEIMTALVNAAKCGVEVYIVTPGVPDKRAAYWLTQSNYLQLLKAGVKIFQYTPGFIHAKVLVCDDVLATVGTINMDYRSLYLHFECGVWLFRAQSIDSIKKDALDTIAHSKEVTVGFCEHRAWPVRACQSILQLFAPLF